MRPVTRTLYNSIVSLLENAGIEDSHIETEILLMCANSTDRTGLYTNELTAKENLKKLRQIIKQRIKRRPLQYLTGEVDFFGQPFLCRPGVFIPRMETETVVAVALEIIKKVPNPTVIDIGTGTGVIGLSIAGNRNDANVICTDINPKALCLASENASRLGVSKRVTFYLSNLFESVPQSQRFHLIVSNPPYIPTSEIEHLQPEIRVYEPIDAIDGGPDGLNFYKSILKEAKKYLFPNGFVLFEIGIDQHEPVKAIAQEYGYRFLYCKKDLLGIPRAIVFSR